MSVPQLLKVLIGVREVGPCRKLFEAAADTGVSRLGELPPAHAVLFFQAIASYKDGIAQGIGYLAQQWADLADGEADEVTKARRAAEAKNALFGENLAKVVVVASKADDERFFAAAQKRLLEDVKELPQSAVDALEKVKDDQPDLVDAILAVRKKKKSRSRSNGVRDRDRDR